LIKDKINDYLFECVTHTDIFPETDEIINIIEMELLDKELAKYRLRLPYFASPEDYWMAQGKIHFIKELKEKLHTQEEFD
jgi:hypothetical protein